MATVTKNLAEMIYLVELTALYTEISKAQDDDLRELARHSIRAAQIFADVFANQ